MSEVVDRAHLLLYDRFLIVSHMLTSARTETQRQQHLTEADNLLDGYNLARQVGLVALKGDT